MRQGLSDLVPTLRWLEAHPDLAERIAAQGVRRFKERVRRQEPAEEGKIRFVLCLIFGRHRSNIIMN